ncbi:MAG: hypothetical protein IJE53_07100 [Bacilli bacterium]|nr:hypothetical protein [Bacilli bacterium]
MIQIKDVVTLSDQNEYLVVSKVDHEYRNYYYLVDINDNSNVLFLYENGEKLTEVEEPELVSKLLPMFYAKIACLL